MNVTDVPSAREPTKRHCCNRPYKTKTRILLGVLGVLIFGLAFVGYWIVTANKNIEPPDPVEPQKPSASKLHVFKRAAVCTDAPKCSEIGKKILLKNGSAVDATIAAMFCNGIYNLQSMGLGGGFIMSVYIKEEKKAYSVIAREKAPLQATVDMFGGDSIKASRSPLAVGVPGELRGMWAVHRRWGKLPWADVVAPTLDLCKEGVVLSKFMFDIAQVRIKEDKNLRETFVDSSGEFHKLGTVVTPSKALCSTFERIAKNGGDDLYNGSLAKDFLDDLQTVGSIITAEDLVKYEAKIVEPLSMFFGNGEILYTPPLPSSGVVLLQILNILSGYHFNSSSIATTEDIILTYHRIIEAFKYAFATRTKLGDPDFLDLNLRQLIANVTSPEYGKITRLRINDTLTSNDTTTYGGTEYSPPDSGTAHISTLAENGDAVSVTSSINFYYGAGFTTSKTGIIMNNVMEDFSLPGIINYFGLKPAPANLIAPGKMPLSSMCPSIIVDKNGDVKLVVGAAGGTKITTAIALVMMRKLWFGQTIKQAVDEPRFHHQIFPMLIDYEFGITKDIIKGLREKGHGLHRYRDRGSVICALYKNETAIYANADFRKEGDVAGMD